MKSNLKLCTVILILIFISVLGFNRAKPDTSAASLLFGSYNYENKSPDLNGNDLGFLAFLVETAGNAEGSPFYIKMEKDAGLFLYPLKPGNYVIKELLLYYKYQDFRISGFHGFNISITDGEKAYMGRISLFLTSDIRGNIAVSVSSGTNNLKDDIDGLGKSGDQYAGYNLAIITNTVSVPKDIYIRGLGLMN
jgi:hypothetical protein